MWFALVMSHFFTPCEVYQFCYVLIFSMICSLFSKSWYTFSCEWCYLPYLQIVLSILPREAVSERPDLVIYLADELTNTGNFHSALKYYLLAVNDTVNVSWWAVVLGLFLLLQLLLRPLCNLVVVFLVEWGLVCESCSLLYVVGKPRTGYQFLL